MSEPTASEAASPESDELYDPQTLAELSEMFGARLNGLLADLDDEIDRRLSATSPDDPGLGATAHALVSVSGTLGFVRLSRACIALEQACLGGGNVARCLDAARRAGVESRRVIAALRTAP